MAHTPLASVTDLEGRLGRELSDEEAIRAELLLDDASSSVRSYTGQEFTSEESTVRVRVRGGRIRLPQYPVTAVDSVDNVDGDPVEFTWYSGPVATLTVPEGLEGTWVDVTYTHGYEEIPAEIVGLICSQVGRALATPSVDANLQSESIGTYSYTIGPAAAAGQFGLLNDERAVLDRYRRVGGTARLGV